MKITKCFLAQMRRSFPVTEGYPPIAHSITLYPTEYRKIRPLICLMYSYNERDCAIHHIDQDKQNNETWNLIALPHKQHYDTTARKRNPFTCSLDMAVFYSITNAWHE